MYCKPSRSLPIPGRNWPLALILILALLLAGCQLQPPVPLDADKAAIDQMLVLIDERLEVAPLVAQAKWNSSAPIEAPEREAQILDQVTEDATEAGVDAAFARHFFDQQFVASKQIQRRLHHQWLQEGRSTFATPPDLAEEVRPVLDRLTPQLIEGLADLQRIAEVEGTGRYLEQRATELIPDDFDGEPRDVAIEPLLERMAR